MWVWRIKLKNLNNQTVIVVLIIVLALALLGFGSYSMRGYGGYGIRGACGMMGGIWCYWPSFGWVIQVLIAIVLVLFIFWLYRQLNGGKK